VSGSALDMHPEPHSLERLAILFDSMAFATFDSSVLEAHH
jgi:hypothetical protein